MKLSENFDLAEFTASSTATRLGLNNDPPMTLMPNLQRTAQGMEQIRTLLGGMPIHVDSGYRSIKVNAAVGGSYKSDHLIGFACDFVCPDFGSPFRIAQTIVASDIQFDQLIMEGHWVHVSFGPLMRKEVLTAHFVANEKTTYTNGLELS